MTAWRAVALGLALALVAAGASSRAEEGGAIFKIKPKAKERSGGRAAGRPAAAPDGASDGAPAAPRLATKRSASADGDTKCAACHQTEGWQQVKFNHDRTGFPLRGGHQSVVCGSCHPRGFDVPVADTCSGCHRDRHAGEFGVHCEGCHDEQSWRSLFTADAHRSTNFPLVGKHALIPCQECHGNMRDRTFLGAAVDCVACHRPAYDQTKLTSIDHAAAGFSTQCQTCHSTWRFWPARVEAHDACFRIASGAHHAVRCLGCHKTLTAATFTGACATGTFTCSSCHAHACTRSDQQHVNVMGYQCADAKCYECHKLAGR